LISAFSPEQLSDEMKHRIENLTPEEVTAMMMGWKGRREHLVSLDRGHEIVVMDGRSCAAAPVQFLEGAEANLLRSCRDIRPIRALDGQALGSLEARGPVAVEGRRCLALPLLAFPPES
jgi:hypothetical protein